MKKSMREYRRVWRGADGEIYPRRRARKCLKELQKSDEGTGEETVMIIPSQKARKCLKEATEEMTRVQKRKQERLYPRGRRESA